MTQSQRTEQELFWQGQFGDDYVGRNRDERLAASNLSLFSEALSMSGEVGSVLELGANIGMNLRALRMLYPGASLRGLEINPTAAQELRSAIGSENVIEGSILDDVELGVSDLVLIKGVLIHIAPAQLADVYDVLVRSTRRLILVCEYYNPTPVEVSYRGFQDKLFKRDFAGELIDRHPSLRLVNYGFRYHRDPSFPLDDVTWFLLEKANGDR